jgi:hypothetical protein
MAKKPQWPKPASNKVQRDELYKAKLEVEKILLDAEIASEAAEAADQKAASTAVYAHHYAIEQEIFKGYIEVAKETAKEALSRAEFIQKVAAAIGGLYTGILAFSFSVSKEVAEKVVSLDFRGLGPTIFFGLAFLCSAAYIGFITHPRPLSGTPSDGTLGDYQRVQRNIFIVWTRSTLLRRRHLLQAAIVGMGLGIVFLPAPFVSLNENLFWWLILIGLLLMILVPAGIYWLIERPAMKAERPEDLPASARR